MVSTIKKIGLTVLLAVLGLVSVNAQTENPQLIALVNKASWCHVCQANGPRVEKDLMPMLMQDKNLQVVVNDLSNKETKAKSNPMLKKAGLTSFAKENTGTGMIYFIDAKTKKQISSISLSKSNEEIMMAYQNASMKDANPKHKEKGHVCDESCKSKM